MMGACLLALSVQGCRNYGAEVEKIVAERDSLQRSLERQSAEFENYEQTVGTLNAALDSITALENLIFFNAGESPVPGKTMRYNLMRLETVLDEQSQRIRQLEEHLAASRDSSSGYLKLIAHMKGQIEAKNRQIARLKAELERKNADMVQMKEQMDAMDVAIVELSRKSERQIHALAVQDSVLNTGYVLIASKRELREKGILRGSRLAPDAAYDNSMFTAVDIREWKEAGFTARRPKILSGMPSSSYELVDLGDRNYMLLINDVPGFWHASKYLIVQTD